MNFHKIGKRNEKYHEHSKKESLNVVPTLNSDMNLIQQKFICIQGKFILICKNA